ncbi:hypothetical protein VP01_1855g3 [Puccinia sorghi]|uniref:Uncharacterized protein n=1 Tax=Puccinia sorghi TaxID=27349 RepID=A0A0L6VFD8_9BASI|nr:hypothetical protein VP01_1855g3 [Puccinia sorghi]
MLSAAATAETRSCRLAYKVSTTWAERSDRGCTKMRCKDLQQTQHLQSPNPSIYDQSLLALQPDESFWKNGIFTNTSEPWLQGRATMSWLGNPTSNEVGYRGPHKSHIVAPQQDNKKCGFSQSTID